MNTTEHLAGIGAPVTRLVAGALVGATLIIAGGSVPHAVIHANGEGRPREEIGRLEVPAQRLVPAGDLLYAVDGDCELNFGNPPAYDCRGTVAVLAVRTPSAPRVVGAYFRPGESYVDLAPAGPYAYLLVDYRPTYFDQRRRVDVLDVRDPRAPVAIGSLPIAGNPYLSRLAIGDGHLYVGAAGNGVHVFALDDPARPRAVAHLAAEARDMTWSSGRLYTASRDGVVIHDVTDAAEPGKLGRIEGDALAVWAFGDALYTTVPAIPCGWDDRGQIIFCGTGLVGHDVHDPAQPWPVLWWAPGEPPLDVFRSGDALYIGSRRLHVLDAGCRGPAQMYEYQPLQGDEPLASIAVTAVHGVVYVAARGSEYAGLRLLRAVDYRGHCLYLPQSGQGVP